MDPGRQPVEVRPYLFIIRDQFRAGVYDGVPLVRLHGALRRVGFDGDVEGLGVFLRDGGDDVYPG